MYSVRFTPAAVVDLAQLRVFDRRRVLAQIRR